MAKKDKKKNKDKKRVDLDIRPHGPLFRNYDYGGPGEGSEVSPGTGLYFGKMDKYKSVKDFLDKARKRKHRKRSLFFLSLIAKLGEGQLSAIIIKGNPAGISQVSALASNFYNDIKKYLESLGYFVSFNSGQSGTPPAASLWVGHSAGSKLLQNATEGIKTLAFGTEDGISHPQDTFQPDQYHFSFTPEMKSAINRVTQELKKNVSEK